MIVGSTIVLDPGELSRQEWTRLFTKLTFLDSDRREVHSYRVLDGGRVQVPRGAWAHLPEHVVYQDERIAPHRDLLTFERELDTSSEERSFSGQQDALDRMLAEQQGIVIAQPGFGKTTVALSFLCAVETPGFVIVHTEDLFEQWVADIRKLIPEATVGRMQGNAWTVGDITVAMVQSVRQDMTRFRRQFAGKFGAVVVDEVHHAPAKSWEMILNCMPAFWRFGFSATETRADGMHPLMRALVGPVIFRQKFESKVPVKVIALKSGWHFPYRGGYDWGRLQNALVQSEERNDLIAERAALQVKKGHSTLILSRRIEHLERLEEKISNLTDRRVTILTGETPRPVRIRILQEFREGEIMCLLSTQLMDEGIDVPILSRVFLTYPGKSDGKLIQQVGRALREHSDKHDAIIFDVVDDRIGVLRGQWMKRKETYNKLKIPVKKNKGEEVDNAKNNQEHRRVVQDRIRRRLGSGRVRNRRARGGGR